MKISPIFEGDIKPEVCNLWAVTYPEMGEDSPNIFVSLFDSWHNTEYLRAFFTPRMGGLANTWKGMTVEQAIDRIEDEADDFSEELKDIETKAAGYEDKSLDDVFEHLHNEEFRFKGRNKDHRKARPYLEDSAIRIYAIKLEDGCFIVTGGGIKLTAKMKDADLEIEIDRIKRVQDYLKAEGIADKMGLLQL
jgi:hypothetical protein